MSGSAFAYWVVSIVTAALDEVYSGAAKLSVLCSEPFGGCPRPDNARVVDQRVDLPLVRLHIGGGVPH